MAGAARGRELGALDPGAGHDPLGQPVAYSNTPIGAVADLMVETGVGRIPIVSLDGRVIGILSRQDLLKARSIRRRQELERTGTSARKPAPRGEVR